MNFFSLWISSINENIYSLLLYVIVCVGVFYISPVKSRVYTLLFESVLFYAIVDVRFFILLATETFFTWIIGNKISLNIQKENNKWSSRLTTIGIGMVVFMLLIFKYFNFFMNMFHNDSLKLMMPLGISYYSFRQISYLADIRMKKIKATGFINYAAYILFFTQMVSGPIARFQNMKEKFETGLIYDSVLFQKGIMLIISGMFKKLVIADRMGTYVDVIFKSYMYYPSLALWIAAILYSLQLYCDFAGYSEIAAGVTNLFGIECVLNFKRPYLATDMKEFWHRWHISLSTWLRDYIYFPLGGSRVSKVRSKVNVMIVFFVCGLWHGSGICYPVWGLYHGFWNIVASSFSRKKGDFENRRQNHLAIAIKRLAVFVIAAFGWILFKSDSLKNAAGFISHMLIGLKFDYQTVVGTILPFTSDSTCIAYVFTLFIMTFLLFLSEIIAEKNEQFIDRIRYIRMFIMTLLIVLFGVTGTGSFLYANY